MSVTAISRTEAQRRIAASLHLPNSNGQVDVPFVAQALRRAIHILAPCPRHEIESAVRKSLLGLCPVEELTGIVEETTEALLVYGDILEMRPLQTDAWHEASVVLRPAPPSFIVRHDQSIILIGVAGDEITPLVGETGARLQYRGPLRILAPLPDENLTQTLSDIGLLELTEAVWLRLPSIETSASYVAKWKKDLLAAPPQDATISGLRVIAPEGANMIYRDRWIEPDQSFSGMYVARRPQRYGNDIWCLVELAGGRPERFLDLHSVGDRLRPCDIAWRIQMALDAQAGAPQRFRIRQEAPATYIDFLTPLPSWAVRKLMISAQRVEPYRSILTFVLQTTDIDDTINFLRQRLWLTPERKGEGGAAQ
jgi:hypothetical protein